jgi:hypothetical protein
MEWIYPIQLDRYGLADEGLKESLESLREETGFDVEDEEQFDFAWSVLRAALKELTTAEWERTLETLDREDLVLFRELLHEHWEDAVRLIGRHKYWQIRGAAFLRHLGHPLARWRATNLSGAMQLYALRCRWGTSYPTKPEVPYYKLAKPLEASDKTIKEWDERMTAAGPPEEGEAFDYFSRIVRPPYKRKGGGT